MKKLVSARLSANILLVSLALLVVFHILVLSGIVPYQVVWGGRVNNGLSMLLAEAVAIFITLLFALIVALKTGYFRVKRSKTAVNVGMWVFFAYLLLNTIGNLASGVTLEKLVLAPVTLILAFFAFRLAIEK